MHSTINYFWIFRSLICSFFLVTLFAFYQIQLMYIPNIQKTFHRKGYFGDVIGPIQFAACTWQATRCAKMALSYTNEKFRWNQTPCVKIRHHSCSYRTWYEIHIISYCLGPQRVHLNAYFFLVSFPPLSISSHVMIERHGPYSDI